MSKPRIRTTTGATVTLTVELTGLGSWGPECTTVQVYQQAMSAAVNRLRNMPHLRIVPGSIKLQTITTDLEKIL
jgi:hypothetical protein